MNENTTTPTMHDLAAYQAITELQAIAKAILGDSFQYDEVVRHLAYIEQGVMTEGATEAIENHMTSNRLACRFCNRVFSADAISDYTHHLMVIHAVPARR